jgi:hypothetical protein
VFVRPYYSFRPRFTFSFGLRVGYGVPYPFTYYDPYAPYNFDVAVLPGYVAGNASAYYSRVGGLSFNIDPMDAAVFLDGQYIGIAEDFAPDQMPLTLPAGRHHVDLRADGFMTASFDITIVAGHPVRRLARTAVARGSFSAGRPRPGTIHMETWRAWRFDNSKSPRLHGEYWAHARYDVRPGRDARRPARTRPSVSSAVRGGYTA